MKKTIAALAIATLLISSLPAVIPAAPPDNAVPASDFSPEQILVKFKPDVTLPRRLKFIVNFLCWLTTWVTLGCGF